MFRNSFKVLEIIYFMGKIKKALAAILLGASLLYPAKNYADEIFSRRADKTDITANVDRNVLELKILPDKYDQRKIGTPKIGHPDIYIIHPKRIRVKLSEILEEGHLVPQYNWVDLESMENFAKFFEKKADGLFRYLSGDEIGVKDWINFLNSFKLCLASSGVGNSGFFRPFSKISNSFLDDPGCCIDSICGAIS